MKLILSLILLLSLPVHAEEVLVFRCVNPHFEVVIKDTVLIFIDARDQVTLGPFILNVGPKSVSLFFPYNDLYLVETLGGELITNTRGETFSCEGESSLTSTDFIERFTK